MGGARAVASAAWKWFKIKIGAVADDAAEEAAMAVKRKAQEQIFADSVRSGAVEAAAQGKNAAEYAQKAAKTGGTRGGFITPGLLAGIVVGIIFPGGFIVSVVTSTVVEKGVDGVIGVLQGLNEPTVEEPSEGPGVTGQQGDDEPVVRSENTESSSEGTVPGYEQQPYIPSDPEPYDPPVYEEPPPPASDPCPPSGGDGGSDGGSGEDEYDPDYEPNRSRGGHGRPGMVVVPMNNPAPPPGC